MHQLPLQPHHRPPAADVGRQNRKEPERLPLNTEISQTYCAPKISTKINPMIVCEVFSTERLLPVHSFVTIPCFDLDCPSFVVVSATPKA